MAPASRARAESLTLCGGIENRTDVPTRGSRVRVPTTHPARSGPWPTHYALGTRLAAPVQLRLQAMRRVARIEPQRKLPMLPRLIRPTTRRFGPHSSARRAGFSEGEASTPCSTTPCAAGGRRRLARATHAGEHAVEVPRLRSRRLALHGSGLQLAQEPAVFRSAGGDDALDNQTTLCAFHHQRGVYAGLVRIQGRAEGDTSELGLRPGLPPARYRSGDRLLHHLPNFPPPATS